MVRPGAREESSGTVGLLPVTTPGRHHSVTYNLVPAKNSNILFLLSKLLIRSDVLGIAVGY